MKPSHRSIFFRTNRLVVAATLGLLAPLAQAATFTWTNTAGGSWAEPTNWSGGTLPTTTADTADFSTLDITAGTTVSLNGNQDINKLLFADTTPNNNWTLNAGTPSTSSLTLGGTSPEISVLNRTLIVNGAELAGSAGLTKTGAGTLIVNKTSFSGGLMVQTGNMQARRGVGQAFSLGDADHTVTINSTGSLSTGGQLHLAAFGGATTPVTQPIVIQGTGEAGANTNAALILQGWEGDGLNISNSITLDGTGTYRIRTFGAGANIKDGVNSINGGITRSGAIPGTLILEAYDFYGYAANPTGGNTIVNTVTTIVNSAIQNNGGDVTVVGNDSSILILQADGHNIGTFTMNYNRRDENVVKLGIDDALTTNQNLTITKGTFDLAGYNQTVNALSGVASDSLITNTDANPSTLTIGNGGGGATFSGLVAAGGAGAISLVKVGAGTATLNSTSLDATNTGFIGGITVSEGTLYLNANRQLSPVTATIASGATLELNLNNHTTDMTFNGEGTLKTSLSVIQAGGAVATFALGANALIDVSGTLWAHNSNVWTSNLSDMTVAGTFNTAFANVRVDALTGPGSGTINLSNGVGDFGLTVGVNDGSGQFDGTIAAANEGGTLRKVGNGTQTLAGPVGYIGDTTVSGGTLVLKQINAANESSTVTIAAGAVLGLDFVGTDTVDKLFFGATQQPMGTYSAISVPAGATITTASFSFGGSLEVTTGAAISDPYDTWASDKGLTGAAGFENGKSDNPDNDSQNNLGEFAFNGDPLSGSDNGKVFVLTEDSDFDVDAIKELILTVAVRTGTPAFAGSPSPSAIHPTDGITYTIEGSLDLGSFPATVNVVPTPVITGLPAVGAGYEYRSFSLDGSNGLTGNGFLRAKVTSP